MSAGETTVSVVIVSWNTRAYLEQCLGSLTSDVCAYPMEILVVDNGSTDGSVECVKERFPHVRLIQSGSNLGFAKANNLGLARCAGKYICLINSDVTVLKDCITRLVDFCEAHPEVGMVGPRVMGADGKLQRSCRGFPSIWNMTCRAFGLDSAFPRVAAFSGHFLRHWSQEDQREVDILSGCFWVVRRTALDQVGPLDESFFMYGEDMDWCRRFWARGWRLTFVPQAEAIHYGGASSANAPVRFFIEKQRADLQYWEKHHGWLARQVYFAVSCLNHLLRIFAYACLWIIRPAESGEQHFKMVRSFQCLRWMFSSLVSSNRLSGQTGQ